MAVSLLFGSIVATFLTFVVIPLGCFSAHKSFRCKDGGGRTSTGFAPSGQQSARWRALLRRRRGQQRSGRPATAPGQAGRTRHRSARNAGRAAFRCGSPAMLTKKTEMEALAPVAETAPATAGGRPPRLEKRSDALPAVAPAAQVTVASGRPPRLEKRSPPPAIVEMSATERPPVVEVKEKPAIVTPTVPARKKPETVKPAAPKPRPTVAKAKPVTVAVPEPKVVPDENTPLAVAKPIVVSESAREPASSRKRKLRGIRIKIMDDGSDEK